MGGGDLNSKKSWHPNTMKNQERVWKAEQAAAEEKKRILELKRERAEERDRAELNEMAKRNAGSSSDNRLNWMYDKPDKKAQDEDYLLGKSIEKNYGQSEKEDQDRIPAIARRVAGSSMVNNASGDMQVDLARKMREDPLLLVKERERAARAALLNNPLQRRRLTELLRKEQEQKKDKVKKSKNKGNIDDKLAAKLTALSGDKSIDIAKLLESDDSSSDSDDDDETSKKKKKKRKEKSKKKSKKSKKKSKHKSDTENSEVEEKRRKIGSKHEDTNSSKHGETFDRPRRDEGYERESERNKYHRRDQPGPRGRRPGSSDEETERRRRPSPGPRRREEQRRGGLSAAEREARLADMAPRRCPSRSRPASTPTGTTSSATGTT